MRKASRMEQKSSLGATYSPRFSSFLAKFGQWRVEWPGMGQQTQGI